MAEVRVVPSGKVYRQLFDAEVQLVHSLARARQRWGSPGEGLLPAHLGGWAPRSDEAGPPGALPARVWMLGTPHRLHKPPAAFARNGELLPHVRGAETEDEIAAREVRNLAVDVVAEKVGSDVVQRVTERRRLKHEAALRDFFVALGQINSDMERRYEEAGERLRGDLSASDAGMEELMCSVEGEGKLASVSFQELEALWSDVEKRSESREARIRELDVAYGSLEDERSDKIGRELRTYAQLMERIAFVRSEEVQRLMDGEAMMLNQSLLANRRALSRLSLHLSESGLQLEASLRKRWEDALRAWRGLRRAAVTRGFREFMERHQLRSSPGADVLVQAMTDGQRELNERRIQLINSLEDLKPPSVTAEPVSAWSSSLDALNRQIDELNVRHVERLRAESEVALRRQLDEVERCRLDLVASGVCAGEEEAWELARHHLLPLVGERQRAQEDEFASMEAALERQARRAASRSRQLAAFAQGAARLWERHKEQLARRDGRLKDRMEASRREHDAANQAKEASLDLLMDQLRQESSEQALESSLRTALSKLDSIKSGYEEFHGQQVAIVEGYPASVAKEVESYALAVQEYYKSRQWRGGVAAADAAPEHGSPLDRDKGSSPERRDPWRDDNGDVFLTETRERQQDEEVDVEEVDVEEVEGLEVDKKLPCYLEHTELREELLGVVTEMLAWEFGEHVSLWRTSAEERARAVAEAEKEELQAEMQLRLHLHGPRASRVRRDVKQARAEELRAHVKEVEQHCASVGRALDGLRNGVALLDARHDELARQFQARVTGHDEGFTHASKPDRLQKLNEALKGDTEAHTEAVRSSLRKFRKQLEDTVAKLRGSNAKFMRSFKLFSEGGNFSPEEIEAFRKRLEQLSRQIDAAEGQSAASLEGLGSKRMEQTATIVGKFEVKFRVMMSDLVILEKIQRGLTAAQVRIKTEVAASNAQSHRISELLKQLRERIDACSSPHVDKEAVTVADLLCHVEAIGEAVEARSGYLDCLQAVRHAADGAEGDAESPGPRAATTTAGTAAAVSQKPDSRVGFTGPGPWAPSGRAMRQAADDPAIATIRRILQTQRARALPKREAEMIEDCQSTATGAERRPPSRQATPGTPAALRGSVTAPRVSARHARARPARPASGQQASSGSASRRSKQQQQVAIEKPTDVSHFEGKIDEILWETYDPLCTAIEDYYGLYKRKDRRGGIPRPEALLPESAEQCAVGLALKLVAYRGQARSYHDHCVAEFRQQLADLEILSADVPEQRIREILRSHLTRLSQSLEALRSAMERELDEWERKKRENAGRLRPALGHPDNVAQLSGVCDDEAERQAAHREGIRRHCDALQERVASGAQEFVVDLAALSTLVLLACDALPTAQDLKATEPHIIREKTSTLLRTRRSGEEESARAAEVEEEVEEEEEEEKRGQPQSAHVWPGLPHPPLPLPGETGASAPPVSTATGSTKEIQAVVTATVTTAKSTRGHRATVVARDRAYQEYLAFVDGETEGIRGLRERQLASAERWERCWAESVRRVSALYQR